MLVAHMHSAHVHATPLALLHFMSVRLERSTSLSLFAALLMEFGSLVALPLCLIFHAIPTQMLNVHVGDVEERSTGGSRVAVDGGLSVLNAVIFAITASIRERATSSSKHTYYKTSLL